MQSATSDNVQAFRVPMDSPDDVSELDRLVRRGDVAPDEVVAVLAKSEGSGEHNDYSRFVAEHALRTYLAAELSISPQEVADRVALVVSGGCGALLAPHATIFTRGASARGSADASDARLAIGVAHSANIGPEELGRMGQIEKVAEATRQAVNQSGIAERSQIHFVQVKAPCLTYKRVADAKRRGVEPITTDLSQSMVFANDASALGVGVALGDIDPAMLHDGVVHEDFGLYCESASTSSGSEKERAEVIVLGNSPNAVGGYRMGHGIMKDLVDADGVRAAIRDAGVDIVGSARPRDAARVVNVFLKLVISSSGQVRGRRFLMIDDPDISTSRAAYTIGAAIVGSVVGDTMVYVSGGEVDSHQGPRNGHLVAAIVKV